MSEPVTTEHIDDGRIIVETGIDARIAAIIEPVLEGICLLYTSPSPRDS